MIADGPPSLEAFCADLRANAAKIAAPDSALPACGSQTGGSYRMRVDLKDGNYVLLHETDGPPEVVISSPDEGVVMERTMKVVASFMSMTSMSLVAFAHPDGSAMTKDEELAFFTHIFKTQEALLRKIDPAWAQDATQENAAALQAYLKAPQP